MSWQSIVKSVAPLLGTALGGPLGGIATKFIADSLNLSHEESPEATMKKITSELNSDLSSIEKLKQAEYNFKKEMKRLDITEEQLRYEDIKDARAREIATGDRTQVYLAFFITFGFFSLLAVLIFFDIQQDQKNLINIMVGSLGTAWVSIINYYFGSSKGSSDKNRLMNTAPSAH